MKKKAFYMELAYLLGLIFMSLGVALMERADFGVSMVVAPAYLLYLKFSETWSFVTFGMMEYVFQAVLLIIMMLVLRRFRVSYLFTIVTAVIYGFILDGFMLLTDLLPLNIPVRACCYVLGMLSCSLGVALTFHTYIAPLAYELVVKELSDAFRIPVPRFKTGYDCASCLLGIVLSFCFFGLWHFEGIRLGTIFCALINGSLIGFMSKWMEGRWEFVRGWRR